MLQCLRIDGLTRASPMWRSCLFGVSTQRLFTSSVERLSLSVRANFPQLKYNLSSFKIVVSARPATTRGVSPRWRHWQRLGVKLSVAAALSSASLAIHGLADTTSRPDRSSVVWIDSESGGSCPAQGVSVSETSDNRSIQGCVWASIRNQVGYLVYGARLVLRCGHLAILFGPVVFLSPMAWLVSPFFPCAMDTWWDMLLWSINQAGVTFTKLGQWASTRPDILSEQVTSRLSVLQQQTHRHSAQDTRRCIEVAFGMLVGEIFDHFEWEPFASGAVGQVHRGILRGQRDVVIVKVMHPGIEQQVSLDLAILSIGARVVNFIPTMHWLSLPEAVQAFAVSMLAQLDFRIEANNLIRFSKNFSDSKLKVRFPKPIRPYIAQHVLVETYEHGIPMSDLLPSSPEKGVDKQLNAQQRAQLASIGLDAFLQMMIVHNFTHADLHPGNMLVDMGSSDNFDPTIVLLDVGLVTELSPYDKDSFIALFHSIATGDLAHGATLMVARSRSNDCVDPDGFRKEFSLLLTAAISVPLGEVEVGRTLASIINLARKYHVKIEPNFCTLCVGIIVLEGIGRQLDPSISLVQSALPLLLLEEPRLAMKYASQYARNYFTGKDPRSDMS